VNHGYRRPYPADRRGQASDIAIEARRVVAEVLVIIESIAGGLEALMRQPEAAPIKGNSTCCEG
jgi:hypothetical protein